MAEARFPMLATVDASGADGLQPRVRPVFLRVGGRLYCLRRQSPPLRQDGRDRRPSPRRTPLSLPAHDQVRITATAEILTDSAKIAEIWTTNPLLRRYLGQPDNPDLIIYRLLPERVRFMREWALEYFEIPIAENPA